MIYGSIVFTDIYKSSKLWESEEDMLKAIKKHNSRIFNIVKKNNGMVVKTIGDSFMIYFEDCTDATLSCMKITESFVKNPIYIRNKQMKIRIGMAIGYSNKISLLIQGNKTIDFVGKLVNAAARLESMVSPTGAFSITEIEPSECIDLIIDTVESSGRYTLKESFHKDLHGVKNINSWTFKLKK